MKNLYRFITILLLIGTHAVFGQCPSGNVTLHTQAQVNAFGANYPNCTEISGDLMIGYYWDSGSGYSDITDLSALSNITSIGGDLSITYNSELQNLNGLNNLTGIGGFLIYRNNLSLENLNGLENLISIGGYLEFYNNPVLQTLDGLNSLTSIGESLVISGYNYQLQNLDGLSNLTSIGGNFTIYNEKLENLNGLSNLTSIGGYLLINYNYSLNDISGLSNIDPATIGGQYGLSISYNPLVQVCNLPNFCTYLSYPADTHPRSIYNNGGDCISVAAVADACAAGCTLTDDVVLTSQADVVNFASAYMYCSNLTINNLVIGYATGSTMTDINDLSPLQSITGVTGNLVIGNNPNLLTLNGLQNITGVGGNLGLNNNGNLQNLNGLNGIIQIGGALAVGYNVLLQDFYGLDSLTQIGQGIAIGYNAHLQSLNGLEGITDVGGELGIAYNPALSDISALQNIDPASIGGTYGLHITNNHLLAVCNLPNFCAYLSNPASTHPREISGNAADCVSEVAVALACGEILPYNETQDGYGVTVQDAIALSDCDVESIVSIPADDYSDETVDATDPCYDIYFKVGSSPGCATIGSFVLDESDTVEIEIEGSVACTEFDQYTIIDQLAPGEAALDVKFINDFVPSVGDSWMIFNNSFSEAVNGTFAGLDEGDTFLVDGYEITISYTDGDGNDITLTVTACPEITIDNLPENQEADIEEGTCQATFGWTEPAFDGGCGDLTVTRTISPYPITPPIAYSPGNNVAAIVKSGVTTVTYSVTDEMGNAEEFSFTLTAHDVEAPEMNCPADITVDSVPGICGAEVTFDLPEATETPCNTATPKYLTKNSEIMDGSMGCDALSSQVIQIYDLSAEGIVNDFQINNIRVGIDSSNGSNILKINLYYASQITSPLTSYAGPLSNYITPFATTSVQMPPGNDFLINIPLPVLVSADAKIYVEVVVPSSNPYMLGYTFDGSNTDQAYVSCGSDLPYSTLQSLGYGYASPVIGIDGEEQNIITPVQTGGLSSGSVFPVGTTTNTFEVTSANGITSSCSFDVIVEDNEAPVITCPVPNIFYGTDEDECSASLSFVATATDNCSAEVTYSLDEEETQPIVFPYIFPLGTTAVYATATDPSGNKAQCEFDVTILTSQLPEIICTDNQLAEVDADMCTYTHNGTDWDAAVALDCNIASITYELTGATTGTGTSLDGVEFNLGETTVTWMVTDNENNTDTCSFTVTVEDNIAPEITCIANQSADVDTDECSYTHSGTSWDAVATDNCSLSSISYELTGATTGNGTSLDGVEFNLGETTITWTVTDNAGNTNTCSFTVTVEDNIAPEITCIANQSADVDTDECSYTHNGTSWDAVATDNCSIATVNYELTGATTGNGTSLDGVEFNLGETTITWTVTDNAGNTNTCSFTVTVEDNIAPEITCASNQSVDVDADECSYTHSGTAWDAVATDNCSIATVNYELSGATTGNGTSLDGVEFNPGETTVTWTVTDNAGNTNTCSFTVTVEDNIAPVAVCVDSFTVELDENGQATITVEDIDNGSFDSCGDVSLVISQDSFDCADIGENAVTLAVTDSNGNTSSCTTAVTVEDNIAPEIFCPDDLEINIATGETYIVPDYLADGDASATDNCSVTVSQNPEPGTELEAGTHTITLTATDQSGNEASCSFGVDVQMGIKSYEINSLTMYPNPARSTVTIGNPQAMNIVKVDVYDLQGRLVYHLMPKNGHSDVTLDVSGLTSGTYLVSIFNDKGGQVTKKLLKR